MEIRRDLRDNARQISCATLIAFTLCLHFQSLTLSAIGPMQVSGQRSVPIIAPGTSVGNEQAERWNRVVLLATPRIASGETTRLSQAIRKAVSQWTLTILATIKPEGEEPAARTFRLTEVGVAYSVSIDSKLTTITSDSASKFGAKLDFYGRQILSEYEKQLAKLKLIVRTPTLTMFDAPTILLRDGVHKDFLIRHLVWIDPRTGKLAVLIWLLASEPDGRTVVVDQPLRVVAPGTREDRKIHVDGRSFFLGLPSARAFALEQLTPGTDAPWTESAKQLAGHSSYNEQQLNDLATALNQLLTNR